MLLLGKTQERHPGDLPSTVPDLPPPPPHITVSKVYKCHRAEWSLTEC